jgi:hypothetical protein
MTVQEISGVINLKCDCGGIYQEVLRCRTDTRL